jgi:hypothetical protein
MGMLFNSQAVVYLGARLTAEFAEAVVEPAKGLAYWQGNSDDAREFRDVLEGSTRNKAPALGSITLEYFDMTVPDSGDGESPSSSDPSGGKSYKRWIVFWKQFRKKHNAQYKKLVDGVHDVLTGNVHGITRITFNAVEDASARVKVDDFGSERRITLYTPVWHKVALARTSARKRNYPRRR